MENDKKWMRISELAKVSGVPKSTIHFYVREKILPEPMKTGRTMAYYNEEHLELLKQIERMKTQMGMPISFIKKQIDLVENPAALTPRIEEEPTPQRDLARQPRDQRRQEIAKASIEVFSQKGFHETRVSDITDTLGISTGTFYLYFQNKRELFVEVVDEVVRAIVGETAMEIKGEKNMWKRLVIRSRTFFENFEKYNEILHQLRGEMTHGDWPEGKIEEVFQTLTRPIVEEMEEAMEQGVIRKMDAELMAYSAIGAIESLTLRATFDDKYTFQSLIAFMGEVLYNATVPRDNEKSPLEQ